jgi:hypothetical protein
MAEEIAPQQIPNNPSGKLLRIGNFRLGKTIGEGSFGKVKSPSLFSKYTLIFH